jgi:Ser-tRNA(Ala) deacylase AlaX
MSSKPLYAEDSYLREFDALVVQSGPKYVILDKTTFYPEGGGQPSDIGVLKWNGQEVTVFKVLKRGMQIYHHLEGNIPKGVEVKGIINWDRRFWNMRRHSAEHLLTGLIELKGVTAKIFSNLEKLEYVDVTINENLLAAIKTEFNSVVEKDIPVKTYYQKREELEIEDDTRKKSFLKKIPKNVELIRMIEIGKYALTFCMGTHVRNTRDIGNLMSLTLEVTKKGRKLVKFNLAQ